MADSPGKKKFFRQCLLNKGNRYTVLWIPDKKAKVGNTIDIIDPDYIESSWIILELWSKKSVTSEGEEKLFYGGSR